MSESPQPLPPTEPGMFAVAALPAGWLRRATLLPAAVVGVVAAVVAGLVAGWPGVAGAALGTAVVVVFFGLDLLALRLVRSHRPDAPIRLAALGYVVKLVGLGLLLHALGGARWLEPPAFAATAVAGTIVWLVAQIRIVGRLVALPTGSATRESRPESPPQPARRPDADLEATP